MSRLTDFRNHISEVQPNTISEIFRILGVHLAAEEAGVEIKPVKVSTNCKIVPVKEVSAMLAESFKRVR